MQFSRFSIVCLVLFLQLLHCYASSSSSNATFNARQAMVGTPKKVMYVDYKGINWNAPQDTVTSMVDAGYNVIIISFFLETTPTDMAQAWASVDAADQQAAIQYAHNKNAIVIVSAGGSTESPYGTLSGDQYGQNVANWAVQNNLDGVDFDMENFGPPLVASGLNPQQTIQWLADAVNSARSILGDSRVITGAPQAPYFGAIGGGANPWTGTTGGYTAVYQASQTTDWYNVQFYNQGSTCYVDYEGLFKDSSSCAPFPGTSVNEIASYGVPLDKIVVGKYVQQGDASNGWIDPGTLGQYFQQAAGDIGWNAGVMGWVWSDPTTNANWINAIYP